MRQRGLLIIIVILAICFLFWQTRRQDEPKNQTPASLNLGYKSIINQPPLSEPPAANVTPTTPEDEMKLEAAYCRLLNANAGIPLTGKIKILSNIYQSDGEGKPGFWAWVQSSDCPPQTFSIVDLDLAGHVKKVVDCRHTSREEIITGAGIQAQIIEVPQGPTEFKVAIRWAGFFVLDCESGLFLSRSGNFKVVEGQIRANNCFVLDQNGVHFDAKGEDIDERGCTPHGTCLDRLTLRAKGDPFRYPVIDRQVVPRALENFNDPRVGPLGPDWDQYPELKVPECLKH
jgi:preprotein translocase subunit YajC